MFGKRYRSILKIVGIVALFFVISSLSVFISTDPASAAKGSAAYCVCVETGEVFFSENEKTRLPMASTTKIMTALVVTENCLPNERVVVTSDTTGVEGSSVYLKPGETFTVKELLYGLMLRSGNDAAETLAKHCAGSVGKFVDMMNYRAKIMGLTDTHFVNPHGLHDKNHFTTTRDLALISCEAMKNDLFREIVGTKFVTVGSGENTRFWSNKNKILTTFEGGNGIKTGFTKDAGRCLVSSATRDGKTVIAVVLNHYDMFLDCRRMMDKAFSIISGRE